MNLLKVFQAKSRPFLFLLVFLSLVSSLINIGLLIVITMAIGGKISVVFGGNAYLIFIGLVVVSFASTAFFQIYMARLTNDIMYNMELSIVEKVRHASNESFEKLGSNRVYSAISDARVLSRVPEILVTLLSAIVTLICSVSYLFYVSFLGGVTVLIMMALLLMVYVYRNKIIEKDLNKVRDLQDAYYESLRELLAGFKQIRISWLRNNNLYHKYILQNRNRAKSLNVKSTQRYVVNELMGTYSWYVVLGVVVFVLPGVFKVSLLQLAAFITTVLFMIAPVSQLVMFFPFYTMFKIAFGRIAQIDKSLQTDAVVVGERAAPMMEFQTIRFENVKYKYMDERNTFELDLPDLTLYREEILFVIGGNGSGKTTFINILTGLAKPVSGKIFIDEVEAGWTELSKLSNSMAVVYTNHHLFRENYDEHDFSTSNEQLRELEQMVNLRGVLKIDKDNDRIDTQLSKGQQKRLALLLALMEDKPIIILDEWAAEQDPQNRRAFYTIWLDRMRKMGKTIIAVSHDDDFYHVGDRVVKFDYGKVVSVTNCSQITV